MRLACSKPAEIISMKAIGHEEFNSLFKDGDLVYVAGISGEPAALVDALEPDCSLRFVQQPFGALNKTDFSLVGKDSIQESYFLTPALQDGFDEGRVKFVPMQLRALFDYLSSLQFDKALLLAAYDREGILRFAHNVDYIEAVLASAKTVVLEITSGFLAPCGSPEVPLDRVSYVLNSESAPITVSPVTIDAVSEQIAEHVASLIRDGDCLQIGVGAVPAAIMARLKNHNDLGFHGGLVDDGVMELVDNGNISGRRKAIDTGQHITGAALGSDALIEWLSSQESVVFRGTDYTHDAQTIRQLDGFTSVNSAVQVDLLGQVNGEMAGGRQISGTGGSVDFMRASKLSKGGRSIVALPSTAKKGSMSRIVPRVEMVTALRTDIDYVVTEFGIAHLRSAPLSERVEALIAIAHPDFRETLRSASDL